VLGEALSNDTFEAADKVDAEQVGPARNADPKVDPKNEDKKKSEVPNPASAKPAPVDNRSPAHWQSAATVAVRKAKRFEEELKAMRTKVSELEANLTKQAGEKKNVTDDDLDLASRIGKFVRENPERGEEVLGEIDPSLTKNGTLIRRLVGDAIREAMKSHEERRAKDEEKRQLQDDLVEAGEVWKAQEKELKETYGFDGYTPENKLLAQLLGDAVAAGRYPDLTRAYEGIVIPILRDQQEQIGEKAKTAEAAGANAESLRAGNGQIPTGQPPKRSTDPADRRRRGIAALKAPASGDE